MCEDDYYTGMNPDLREFDKYVNKEIEKSKKLAGPYSYVRN